jgi:hypothetical protein
MRLEGLGQLKNPKTSSRIVPTTFWLAAKCLNKFPCSLLRAKCKLPKLDTSELSGCGFSVDTVTELGAGLSRNRDSIPGRSKLLSFTRSVRTEFVDHRITMQWIEEAFWGMQSIHSPFSVRVKNSCSLTSIVPYPFMS